MEHKISSLPLDKIRANYFNSQNLSDITFLIDGNEIYGHSQILIAQSSVFHEQLNTTMCDNKIFHITDYEYDVFYQFIKFMYTAQVDISSVDVIRLFNVAKHYNVIGLVNHLLNNQLSYLKKLNLFVAENQLVGLNCIKLVVAFHLRRYLESSEFVSLHPNTVQEILKFDEIENRIPESYIIDALVRWLEHNSKQNQIEFTEYRQQFAHLIHLVRFPTMSEKEMLHITTKYPALLTESDLKSFKTANSSDYKPRKELVWPYVLKPFPYNDEFETKFVVSSEMILGGFVFGRDPFFEDKQLTIKISCQDHSDLDGAIVITQINLKKIIVADYFGAIHLGASIWIRPNYIYTIGYTFNEKHAETHYSCRKSQDELIINGPVDFVKILEAHDTMFEIWFIQPESEDTDRNN